AMLRGIECDPVAHVRRLRFATDLCLLDRPTRLRFCRAAVAILTRNNVYAPEFMPTLLGYLPPDEIEQLRNDLANRRFFADHVPDLAERMINDDLPIAYRQVAQPSGEPLR